MKKIIYGLGVGIVVLALVILGNRAPASDELRLGVISSETGDFAAVGKAFSEGVKFAHEEYIKANPGAKVTISIEDDGSQSKKALSAYNKLVSLDKVQALINLSSPSINIIYDSVSTSKMPVIQLGEQDVAPTDDTVYQIYPTQDAPQVATGEFVKKMSNGNDTVLFYTNDSTAIKFVDNIRKGYGQPFVEEYKLDLNQREYASVVAKAMAHKPKYVVMSTFSSNGIRVLQEMLKYPNRPTIVFDLIYSGAEYSSGIPNMSVLDGSYVMSLKQNIDPVFISKYKARYGAEPSVFAAYGYDAFNTMIAGYDTDWQKTNRNMKSMSFTGATGKVSFSDTGLRQPEFEMKVLKGGELKEI